MRLFQHKAQPKEEHPNTFPATPARDARSDPPQGGSVIAHPLLNRLPNPALDIIVHKSYPPRPRVDPRLIGEEQR